MSRCSHSQYLRRVDSSRSLSSTTTTTTACSMCASAWAEMMEKEQNRLALLQERFELDKAMFKVDRKNYRREQVIFAQHQATEIQRLKMELVAMSKQLTEEIRTNKTLDLEWKLKFQAQGRELEETKRTMQTKVQALQMENHSLMAEMEKQAQLSMEMTAKIATEVSNARMQQEEMEQLCRDLETRDIMLKELQEQVETLQSGKEANRVKTQHLEQQHEAGFDKTAVNILADSPCANCVNLQKDIDKLEQKLKESLVDDHVNVENDEHQIERTSQQNDDEATSAMQLALSSSSPLELATEMQEIQTLETEKITLKAEFIALETKHEVTERGKAAVELQLKETKAEMYKLSLQLDQLQNEVNMKKPEENIEENQLLQFDFVQQMTHSSKPQKNLQDWENILFSIGD